MKIAEEKIRLVKVIDRVVVVLFQSLIGILVDCNAVIYRAVVWKFIEFQSLIGILVDCNTHFSCNLPSPIKFQSLIGILVDCNIKVDSTLTFAVSFNP